MKLRFLISSIGLLSANAIFAQSLHQYNTYIRQADSLYNKENYSLSAETYRKAFDIFENKITENDGYNAACSYALAGNTEQAFHYLFYVAENSKIKYNNLSHLSIDSDLTSLHADKRWKQLLKIVHANKEEYEKDFDKVLVAELDSIRELDQVYRLQLGPTEEQYGRESDEMKELIRVAMKADSLNLIKVTHILDKRGWLGPDSIGKMGNITLFMVIQHADIDTQIKYLPMMRDAAAKGNANPSHLALLEDRVAYRQGKRQIYGSQIGRDPDTDERYVFPIMDPEHVNERRASVGLEPIEDYVKNWGITWNVDKHKKQTQKIEARKNKAN